MLIGFFYLRRYFDSFTYEVHHQSVRPKFLLKTVGMVIIRVMMTKIAFEESRDGHHRGYDD